MTVELLSIATGAICGSPGDVVEVTDEQAAELIAGNFAKAVNDGPEDNANIDAEPATDKRAKRTPKGK